MAKEEDHPRREYITNTHAHLSEDQDDIFVDGVIDKRAVAELAVFSWPNFLTRLHAMREVYDDFHHGKIKQGINGDHNPFFWTSLTRFLHAMREVYDDVFRRNKWVLLDPSNKKHDWDVEPDPWGEMSYFDHHEHHVEKNLHASARQSAVEAAESLMMQQGDLASSKGAGARGLAAAQKKGNLDLEAKVGSNVDMSVGGLPGMEKGMDLEAFLAEEVEGGSGPDSTKWTNGEQALSPSTARSGLVLSSSRLLSRRSPADRGDVAQSSSKTSSSPKSSPKSSKASTSSISDHSGGLSRLLASRQLLRKLPLAAAQQAAEKLRLVTSGGVLVAEGAVASDDVGALVAEEPGPTSTTPALLDRTSYYTMVATQKEQAMHPETRAESGEQHIKAVEMHEDVVEESNSSANSAVKIYLDARGVEEPVQLMSVSLPPAEVGAEVELSDEPLDAAIAYIARETGKIKRTAVFSAEEERAYQEMVNARVVVGVVPVQNAAIQSRGATGSRGASRAAAQKASGGCFQKKSAVFPSGVKNSIAKNKATLLMLAPGTRPRGRAVESSLDEKQEVTSASPASAAVSDLRDTAGALTPSAASLAHKVSLSRRVRHADAFLFSQAEGEAELPADSASGGSEAEVGRGFLKHYAAADAPVRAGADPFARFEFAAPHDVLPRPGAAEKYPEVRYLDQLGSKRNYGGRGQADVDDVVRVEQRTTRKWQGVTGDAKVGSSCGGEKLTLSTSKAEKKSSMSTRLRLEAPARQGAALAANAVVESDSKKPEAVDSGDEAEVDHDVTAVKVDAGGAQTASKTSKLGGPSVTADPDLRTALTQSRLLISSKLRNTCANPIEALRKEAEERGTTPGAKAVTKGILKKTGARVDGEMSSKVEFEQALLSYHQRLTEVTSGGGNTAGTSSGSSSSSLDVTLPGMLTLPGIRHAPVEPAVSDAIPQGGCGIANWNSVIANRHRQPQLLEEPVLAAHPRDDGLLSENDRSRLVAPEVARGVVSMHPNIVDDQMARAIARVRNGRLPESFFESNQLRARITETELQEAQERVLEEPPQVPLMESEVPLSEIESELDRMRDSLEESIRRSPGGPRGGVVPEQRPDSDSDDHLVVQGGEEESGDLATGTTTATTLYLVTLSHFLTNVGWQAWQFVIPLYLDISYAASYGLVIMLANLFLSPRIAPYADRATTRMRTVSAGILLQIVGLVLGMAVLWASCSWGRGGSRRENNFHAQEQAVFFVLLCVGGVCEKLGNVLTLNSVKRDWTPWLFTDDLNKTLPLANSFLSRADLLAEMTGPVLAGCVLAWWAGSREESESKSNSFVNLNTSDHSESESESCGAVLFVGMLNLVSFAPQWLLLRLVWQWHHKPRVGVTSKTTASASTSGGATSKADAQPELQPDPQPEHEAYWLTICYALCWFNALSPHGVVLTAYLAANGLDSASLSLFRASGAAVGATSVYCFRFWGRKFGLARSTCFHLRLLAGCVLVATLAEEAASCNKLMTWTSPGEDTAPDVDAPPRAPPPGSRSRSTVSWLPFLCCVVVSRIGLYGFELGEMELSQRIVRPEIRLRVASIESALCSCGTAWIFGMGILFATPNLFVLQLWSSTAAVLAAAALFERYRLKYLEGGGADD
eukprot:g11403.t1